MKHRLAPPWIDETLRAVILSDLTKTTSRKPQPPKLDLRMKIAAVGWKKHRLCIVVNAEGFPLTYWTKVQ